jgi:hypothetical protein
MCIIIFKPKGKIIELPLIKEEWDRNPDGAGFAVKLENRKYPIFFKKGFMELEHLLNDPDFSKFNSKEFELVLHLRKATHGGISPLLCHPFPLIGRNRLTGYSTAVIFHNGVFGVKVPKGKSDTLLVAEFARRIGFKNFKFMLHYDILNRAGSRVLLFAAGGNIFKGQWHTYKGLKTSKPIYSLFCKSTDKDREITLGSSGIKLRVLNKTTDGILLDDGSLWEVPPELEEMIEIGDVIEF